MSASSAADQSLIRRQWNRRRQHNGRSSPRGYGVTVNENVFNGMRTTNSISQAESQVLGAREQLRNTEQNTLLAGSPLTWTCCATRRSSISIATTSRCCRNSCARRRIASLSAKSTRTDVAQAEASLASARATALSAQSRRCRLRSPSIGRRSAMSRRASRRSSRSCDRCPELCPKRSRSRRSSIRRSSASLHGVDAALLQVKIAEGALYPTVGLTGQLLQRYDANAVPWSHVWRARSWARSPCRSTRRRDMQQPDRPRKAGAAGTADRFATRPGACGGRCRVGPQSEPRSASCAPRRRRFGRRSRARRRARRGESRPAHDARRAQRSTGAAQRTKSNSSRPSTTRSSIHTSSLSAIGRLNHPDPGARRRRIRSARPFRTGQEQVDRAAARPTASEAPAAKAASCLDRASRRFVSFWRRKFADSKKASDSAGAVWMSAATSNSERSRT